MTTTSKKQSRPSGQKPPSYVTFTQQLLPEFWPGWDIALILSGDVLLIGREILARYEAAGGLAQGDWIIKHDKDVLADGCPKEDHVHVVIQQSAGRQVEGKLQCFEIDAAIGFDKSIVRAPSRGGRIENAWSYLIHAKDPDKHQYSPCEVQTIRGKDYIEIEAEYRRSWARRAVVSRNVPIPMKEWNELGDALVQKVLDGEVDEMDLLRDKTLMDIYTRNETKVNLAFKVRARRDMMLEVEKLRAGVFKKTFIWATGASDQGKSYLVESIAAELAARLGWTICRAAARNGLDDYNGQQILILNEPGPRVLEWPDLLQLTGPSEAGPVSARFTNKPDAAPRVILVAVSIDPVEFGFFVPGKRSTSDSLDQLVRRITLTVKARKIGDIPHYSVSEISAVAPYTRRIQVPGRDGAMSRTEMLSLSYDESSTEVELTHAEALDKVLDAIATRSPDAGLGTVEQRRLATDIEALAERGIVFAEHPVLVSGGAA